MGILLSAGPVHAYHRLPPGTDGWQVAGLDGVRGVTIGPIESDLHHGVVGGLRDSSYD